MAFLQGRLRQSPWTEGQGTKRSPYGDFEAQRVMDEPNSNYLTPEGIKKLQDELDYLINVRRPEVARQIADAKADGDVSENAGYDEAKNTQAFVEGRILTSGTS